MQEPVSTPQASVAQLRTAILAGDVAARTELGKRLLSGQGTDISPAEGASLIATAAQAGDGEAAGIAAVLIAANASTAAHWTMALEYLQQAAEAGWIDAQKQLAFLSPSTDLVGIAESRLPPPDIWGRLRRSIDISAWLSPPAARLLSEAPYIAEFETFLTKEQCGWLIDRARSRMSPAKVFDRWTAKTEVGESRTNSAYEFNPVTSDVVLMLVCARIAAASGFPCQALEHSNVLHYRVGQQFTRHYDFLDPRSPAFSREIAARGQRAATFLIYLNEDFDRAETDFPVLDRRFRCRTGGALIFKNIGSSGQPDRSTLHAGLAPTRGEKWLFSQWIRSRPSAA